MSTTGTILKESIDVYEITEQASILFSNSPYHVERSNDIASTTLLTATSLSTTLTKNNNNHVDNDNNNNNIDDDDDLKLLSFIDDKRNELIKSWNQLEKSMMKQQHDDDTVLVHGNNDCVGNLRNNVQESERTITSDDMNIDNFMNKDGSNEEMKQQHSILFLEMMTDSFATELEDLQQRQQQLPQQKQQNDIDVLLLVDCLQSGMDLLLSSKTTDIKHSDDFAWIKQEHHMNDSNIEQQQQDNNKSLNVNKTNMSAHEKRRQQLGYIV